MSAYRTFVVDQQNPTDAEIDALVQEGSLREAEEVRDALQCACENIEIQLSYGQKDSQTDQEYKQWLYRARTALNHKKRQYRRLKRHCEEAIQEASTGDELGQLDPTSRLLTQMYMLAKRLCQRGAQPTSHERALMEATGDHLKALSRPSQAA